MLRTSLLICGLAAAASTGIESGKAALIGFDGVIDSVMAMANATLANAPQVDAYPSNGIAGVPGWVTTKYNSWTSGFWPGLLWKLYNLTTTTNPDASSAWWLENAVARTWPINPESNDTGTHDVGFMVYTSFGNQYRLTGNLTARAIALQGAASLAKRFVPSLGVFRSWGTIGAVEVETIADNLLNLELMFWAGVESGNTTYTQMAASHATVMIRDLYQPFNPGCAWHLIVYNETDGSIISRTSTPQGLGPNTVWARGQAWTINGFAIAYRFTQDPAYLTQAQAASDCFIRSVMACCDNDAYRLMPLWDFFAVSPNATIDTSASMIAASGMIEMAWHLPADLRTYYLSFAYRSIVSALGFWSFAPGSNDAVLNNGTVTFPLTGIPIIYGDYYLTESWMRWQATPTEWRQQAMDAAAAQEARKTAI